MVCLLWNYGIQLFLSLEIFLMFQIERGNLLMGKTNLTSKSMDVMQDIDSVPSNVQSASRDDSAKMCVIRIIHPRRLNAKVVLITQKDEEINCISRSRWFSKIIRKRLRIPRTQSETGIHREERISAENLMAIGKSFTT